MAVTEIDMINAALFLVGENQISSATDLTKPARLVQSMYELCYEEMFNCDVDWKFATVRAQLSPMSTTPAFGSFDYQFILPAHCARVIAQVNENDDGTEYQWRREMVLTGTGNRVENDVLLSNETPAYIKYIRIRQNPAKWPAWFRKIVYINLAIMVCDPLKRDKQKKNQLMVMFEQAWGDALAANAREDIDVDDDGKAKWRGHDDVIDASADTDPDRRYIELQSS